MKQFEAVQLEDLRRLEVERQQLEHEKSRFDSDRRDLTDQKTRQAAKESDLAQLEQRLNARSSELEGEQVQLEHQKERIAADLKELADERSALDKLHQATVAARSHLEQVRREMWPASFLNGSLSGWREKLEARMSEPHSPARMIYLSLAKCSTLSARNDVTDLPLELRELGRHAYQFFNQLELDADEQFKAATDWTQALEPEFAGLFFFRIVKVGQLKDQTWMTFEPSTGPVNRVISWSIQNQRRMTVQRALVE